MVKTLIWENKKVIRHSKEWYEWLLGVMNKYNINTITVQFSKNKQGVFFRDRVQEEIDFKQKMEIEKKEIIRLLDDFTKDINEFEYTNFNSASRERGYGIGTKLGVFWLGKKSNTLILRSNKNMKTYLVTSNEDIKNFINGKLNVLGDML